MFEIYFTFLTSVRVVSVNASGIRVLPLIVIDCLFFVSIFANRSPAFHIEFGVPVVAALTLTYLIAAPPHAERLPNIKPLQAPSIAPSFPPVK